MKARVQLEVDLTAITDNYQKIAAHVAPCVVLPVIKYDGYNMGALRVAKTLKKAGASRFFTATANEALELCKHGFEVQIAGNVAPFEIPDLINAGVICPINSLDGAHLLNAEAARQKKRVEVHFQVDTGMGRDGIPLDKAQRTIDEARKLPWLNCTGIYSHFPGALPEFSAFTKRQIIELKKISQKWQCIHWGGSDGMANYNTTTQAPFTHCRVGLALYGLGSAAMILDLKQVFTLKSTLVLIRELPAGSNIGYNFIHTLKQRTRVGTVAIGYADGLPIALSNCGEVIIHGHRCPIIGRVSMDYITVDLNGVPAIAVGDEVVCLNSEITATDWAELKQTHSHEILCSLGNRIKRIYKI